MINKTRQNLIVSVDDRQSGDYDVMSIKTTSNDNVIIEFSVPTNKMSVNVEDLQDALDQIKQFMASRPKQPESLKPLGTKHIEALGELEEAAQEEFVELNDEFGSN